ncbi:hypothetical protein M427DRAFT_286085 [Gonapodya prolifera JEL478]|uniref:STI1 domain-containing protein n=1 Tax=Gonapodya prolifera (strain JEL478) TaxID=1344416 RepID=A0A139AJ83_GONPJ|nr:hypothetical protein M427DRAFT_286085 [Gonapodya prolifera JEL478]|eukprot:KXS16847.1 hypothetical protein M427DRAFT_286085 [Gonapodya prolifera JEL478]
MLRAPASHKTTETKNGAAATFQRSSSGIASLNGPPPLEQVEVPIPGRKTASSRGQKPTAPVHAEDLGAIKASPVGEAGGFETSAMPGSRLNGFLAARSARKTDEKKPKATADGLESSKRKDFSGKGAAFVEHLGHSTGEIQQGLTSCVTPLSGTAKKEASKESSAFGGLKKGFFGAKSASKTPKAAQSTSKPTPSPSSTPDIPYLKPASQPTSSPLALPDLSAASTPSVLNPALLSSVESDPSLLAALENPRFVQAIGEFQKDPKAAAKKYANDPIVAEAMAKFTKLIGGRVLEMAKEAGMEGAGPSSSTGTTSTPLVHEMSSAEREFIANYRSLPSHERALVDTIRNSAEMQAILRDPKVQNVLATVQRDRRGLDIGAIRDPELVQKLRKLQEVGILSVK